MEKKIAFLIDSNSPGGAERVISILTNYFANKSYKTFFINSDSSSDFYKIDNRVFVKKMKMDFKKHKGPLFRVKRFLSKIHYIRDFIRNEKPDALVPFLFNMEFPTIIAGMITKTKVYTSVRNSSNSYPKYQKIIRKIFYPKIAGVVFQSTMVRNSSEFRKLNNSKVIMNPLSENYCKEFDMIKADRRKRWIISVGRLESQKNPFLLLKAFSKVCYDFPEYELHFFGVGSLENDLKNLTRELNLKDKVFFDGVVKDASLIHRDAMLYVMASNYEGFPNSLVEAMACGLPVISTNFDSGVAAELIIDGVNGFLTPVNDEEKLCQIMKYVLSNEELIDKLSSNALKINKILNNEKICEEWENFLFKE